MSTYVREKPDESGETSESARTWFRRGPLSLAGEKVQASVVGLAGIAMATTAAIAATTTGPVAAAMSTLTIATGALAFLWSGYQVLLEYPRSRRGVGAAAAVAVLTAAAIVVPNVVGSDSCEDPVELSVLLPVDGAHGFETAIDEFTERYTTDGGCQRANVTPYAAAWPDIQRAMASGWADDEENEFHPLRDVGPGPDLWVAESATQIEWAAKRLEEAGGPRIETIEGPALGTTPLVVAVPEEVYNDHYRADPIVGGTLPQLVRRLREDHDVPVVRSDPVVSYTALRFLESLYVGGDDLIGKEVENRLARSVHEAGLGLPGTDTELLCDVTRGHDAEHGVAVLTTERALSAFNRGEPLGADCPLSVDSRTGLSPVYLEGLGGLDYRAARLDWDEAWTDRRAQVAEDLAAWLAEGEGTEDGAPERWGIRSQGHDGESIDGARDFETGFDYSTEPLGASRHDELLAAYGTNRLPTNVLLAIDASLTMGVKIDGEGRSRFELAAQGVEAALAHLSPDTDGSGLWAFPGRDGRPYGELFAIGTGRGPGDAAQLDEHELRNGVDLHQTIVDGVEALTDVSVDDSIEAMVVLTDGDDEDRSGISAADVGDRIAASEVSLYIIAVGDASCRSEDFKALKEQESRVTCVDADEDLIKSTFDQLFRRLWG